MFDKKGQVYTKFGGEGVIIGRFKSHPARRAARTMKSMSQPDFAMILRSLIINGTGDVTGRRFGDLMRKGGGGKSQDGGMAIRMEKIRDGHPVQKQKFFDMLL